MKTLAEDTKSATDESSAKRQDNDKTRRRTRSGTDTLAYWKSKLFRNTYRDRNGDTVEIPEWYARLSHDGTSRRVRLGSANKDNAAEEALALSKRLRRDGWVAVDAQLAKVPSSPTIREFVELYRGATDRMERKPRPITITTYSRCLHQVCALAGVQQIRQLNRAAIERARDAYRVKARKQGRSESSIQNTLAKIMRNAAACFSSDARAALERGGLKVDNPFAGIKRTQDIQPVSSLPASLVERIWNEAALLRDGDPGFTMPVATAPKKPRQKHAAPDKRPPAWRRGSVDFSQPHPDAYCALLLALGAGLRANEIDKARWTWLKTDGQGNHFIEVRAERDFAPKGGTHRLIKIPQAIFDALTQSRRDLASPYILGGSVAIDRAARGEAYRSPRTFRTVNAWLRERGVDSEEKRSHPLHRLRKQFGSFVATEFGLFAAQKLLGHASPAVTAKYYAAQTELPELTHVRIVG